MCVCVCVCAQLSLSDVRSVVEFGGFHNSTVPEEQDIGSSLLAQD